MNRAQRRQQKRRERCKPNRSRAIYTTNFQLEFESFDTLERLFQQIRNGELRYDTKDGWVMMGLFGQEMHILSALEGWLLYWRTLADEHHLQYDETALRKLAKSLEYDKPLNLAEVDAAYAVLQRQRALYRAFPKAVTTRMAHQVKAELNRQDEIRELIGRAA